MREVPVRCLAQGVAEGAVTILRTPLSFWGGFDIATGTIIDRLHPSCGEILRGRIVVMPCGRGSSSTSSVLAEALRVGTAPSGIVLAEPDSIITVGSIVARKLYGKGCPVVVCSPADYLRFDECKRARIVAQGNEGVVILVTPNRGGGEDSLEIADC